MTQMWEKWMEIFFCFFHLNGINHIIYTNKRWTLWCNYKYGCHSSHTLIHLWMHNFSSLLSIESVNVFYFCFEQWARVKNCFRLFLSLNIVMHINQRSCWLLWLFRMNSFLSRIFFCMTCFTVPSSVRVHHYDSYTLNTRYKFIK